MFNHSKLAAKIATGDFSVVLDGQRRGAVANGSGTGTFGSIAWKVNSVRGSRYTMYSLTLTNRGESPVDVGDIVLFTHAEDDTLGDLGGRIIYDFRNSLGSNYVVPVTAFGGVFNDCPMFLVTDGKRTLLAAQMTFQFNEMHFKSAFGQDGRLLKMECLLEAASCPLLPGASFTTDSVALYDYDERDPLEALYEWADDVRTVNQPDIPEQTWAGLVSGTLYSGANYTIEGKTLCQLENLGNLPKLGVKYYWISISNLLNERPGNWLYPNDKQFPHGLRNLLDRIRSAGMEPGFWLNPFAITSDAIDFERMKPYLIRKKDGTPASRGTWLHAKPDANGNLPELFALDPAYPEVYDYIANVLRTYASWGIRYYMIDFLGQGRYQEGERSSGYALENYLRFMRKLKAYAAPGTHFLAATGASIVHIGAISSSRIGLDYCEGRPLHKHWPSYPATYVIGGSLRSSGAPQRNAVNNMAMWAFADKAFFRCNSNLMVVDKPIPLSEARMTTTLYGISSSPVFLGDYLKELDPERKGLLKKILPRGKEMPLPVDLFTQVNVDQDFVRVFRLEIQKPWGTYYICAIFNLNDTMRTLRLADTFLRIPVGKRYRLYDFWNEEYRGTFAGETEVEVPAQSAMVLRIEECKEHPWLLSTDITVRQGDAEVTALEWDEKALCLTGTAHRAPGEEGNLFFIAPDKFKIVNDNYGFLVFKSAKDMSLVIKKHLVFDAEDVDFKIPFELWEGTSDKFKVER
ncbi:MAG: hypothetical protein IKR81_14275 [Victivallales bacterium]|nr:hypothetical protein [Victivallales bacterium]